MKSLRVNKTTNPYYNLFYFGLSMSYYATRSKLTFEDYVVDRLANSTLPAKPKYALWTYDLKFHPQDTFYYSKYAGVHHCLSNSTWEVHQYKKGRTDVIPKVNTERFNINPDSFTHPTHYYEIYNYLFKDRDDKSS